MDVSKIDHWSFVALMLPGLVLVQAYFLARDYSFKGFGKDDLVVYPAFSLLYALLLWFNGYAIQTGQTIFNLPPGQLFLLYIAIPTFIGGAIGAAGRYFAPPPPPPIRTPWPVIAPRISVGTYLMVILKDKTIYRALVTEDSQLSSDQDKIDLYLGQTFEGEEWTPSSPQRAVYIRGSEIQSIEIWKFGDSGANQSSEEAGR